MESPSYKISNLRNTTQHKMNFVKIQHGHAGPYDWTEYSFLFFGKFLGHYDKKSDEIYTFSLWNGGKRVFVRNSKESFDLTCNSLSLFGFTVVWRFESTLWEFIKDVWSKLTH